MLNAGDVTVMVSAEVADPPVFFSVNTCGADAVPGASMPKSDGLGDQASTGTGVALATSAPVPSTTAMAPAATAARRISVRIIVLPPFQG
jgi:hypothetical protein